MPAVKVRCYSEIGEHLRIEVLLFTLFICSSYVECHRDRWRLVVVRVDSIELACSTARSFMYGRLYDSRSVRRLTDRREGWYELIAFIWVVR